MHQHQVMSHDMSDQSDGVKARHGVLLGESFDLLSQLSNPGHCRRILDNKLLVTLEMEEEEGREGREGRKGRERG